MDNITLTYEEFLAYCEKNGEQAIACDPDKDAFKCATDHNGDLLAEVWEKDAEGNPTADSYRFRKYPHPIA